MTEVDINLTAFPQDATTAFYDASFELKKAVEGGDKDAAIDAAEKMFAAYWQIKNREIN